MTRDEVFVPKTRKELGYPEIKEEGEVLGINVSEFRQQELREALAESPIGVLWGLFLHQVFGWPLYLFLNSSGQLHYPKGTNHFDPSAIIFKPSHFWQIIVSNLGLVAAISALAYWSYMRSFTEMMVIYGIPYLWVNQ
jgi:omega-6 fatty acid desaturase (delta-12 desaturase)